jgi:hypothetical protein
VHLLQFGLCIFSTTFHFPLDAVFDFLLSFLYFWSNLVEIKISNRKRPFDDFATFFRSIHKVKVFQYKFVILCTFYTAIIWCEVPDTYEVAYCSGGACTQNCAVHALHA